MVEASSIRSPSRVMLLGGEWALLFLCFQADHEDKIKEAANRINQLPDDILSSMFSLLISCKIWLLTIIFVITHHICPHSSHVFFFSFFFKQGLSYCFNYWYNFYSFDTCEILLTNLNCRRETRTWVHRRRILAEVAMFMSVYLILFFVWFISLIA